MTTSISTMNDFIILPACRLELEPGATTQMIYNRAAIKNIRIYTRPDGKRTCSVYLDPDVTMNHNAEQTEVLITALIATPLERKGISS